MAERTFAHLHCHTHYSMLDGASRIPELVKLVKSHGQTACAITDHGNLFGAVEFYTECKAAGINPIVGYEAYVAPGRRTEKKAKGRGDAGFHLTILAKNRVGFKNLVKLSTIASVEGYYYVPRIDKEALAAHREGLVVLSGCVSSEFSRLILAHKMDEARDLAGWFSKVFGEDFYVEIQDNGLKIQETCRDGAVEIAGRLGLPLVATSDAHYLTRDDAPAHDVLLCVSMGKKLADPDRMRYGNDDDQTSIDKFHVCSTKEMYSRMPGHGEAIRRSQQIADGCSLELELGKRHFPVYSPPPGKTPEAYLRELCESGVAERYGSTPPAGVAERLDHELGIINRMGFAGYFLIVWDFVRFSREQGIAAGARGSAVGALVSYALYLSHVCPLRYNLLFERFLDPNRSEAPDIDIDFCQARRGEVIEYVKQKYGADSVAQIGTFGTLGAKAALKDVCRVMGFPPGEADRLSKMVPDRLGTTLGDALAPGLPLADEYAARPDVRRVLDIARRLEGTNRNPGTHPAGVVISAGPLVEHVPLYRPAPKGEDVQDAVGGLTTQWDMGVIEKVGLLKMDCLGLRNLTILDAAVRTVGRVRGEWLDLDRLPDDDPATYALLQRGDTAGVFQFESEGIREMLKRMKPDRLEDLIAANALYRPGPLNGGLVDAFIDRKHGRESIPVVHPVYDRLLANTYGVVVFQEQCMQILNQLGGIELAKAYGCIKAISKKKQDLIDANESAFVTGAVASGLPADKAREIFGLIKEFGAYGFNRSHSCAYADLAYRTAFLKAHYRPEFTAALLSSDGKDRNVLVAHIEDARRAGIDVLPPDINLSRREFTVDAAGRVLFGLAAVRGFGESAAWVETERAARGPFRHVAELAERLDPQACPRSHLETLLAAGGLDCLLPPGGHRAQLAAALPALTAAASREAKDRRKGRRSLFDGLPPDDLPPPPLPDVPPWPPGECLRREKEALDLYLSGHPLAEHADRVRAFASHAAGELEAAVGRRVVVGGLVAGLEERVTKNPRPGSPSRYARFRLEDPDGSVECVVWPDAYLKCGPLLKEDAVVYAAGAVESRDDRLTLVVGTVVPPADAPRALARGLAIRLSAAATHPVLLEKTALLLARYRGVPGERRVPVYLVVADAAGRTAEMKAADEWAVAPAAVAVDELEDVFGPGNVRFMGSRRPAAPPPATAPTEPADESENDR